MSVGFRGVVLSAPGVASYIDDAQATSFLTNTPNAVSIVGIAERGQPNTALAFTDAASAAAIYGNGGTNYPLVDGISRALNAGAGTVYGVRVGAATPGTTNITSGGVNAIAATTNEYGKFAKSWYLVTSTGTNAGTKKATLTLHDNRSYAVDNIGENWLKIIGTGTAGGKVTISGTGVTISTTSTFTGSLVTGSGLLLTIDTNSSGNVSAVAITASGGGTNYALGDLVTVEFSGATTKAIVQVTGVSTGGVVTSVALTTTTGAGYGASLPPSGGRGTTPGTNGYSLSTIVTTSTLNVTDAVTGMIRIGDTISGSTTPANTTVLSLATGTQGLAPASYKVTYTVSGAATYTGGAGISTKSATFLFADYSRLDNLVAIINSTFSLTTAGLLAAVVTGESGSQLCAGLDRVTDATINAAATQTYLTLTANGQAMVNALNGPILGTFLVATLTANYGSIDNNTYGFAGADDGTITATDWTNAFSVLQNVPAYFVVPMTGNLTYHKTAQSHVEYMSSVTGKFEKLAVCGADLGETAANAILNAASMNSKRVVRVWPGVKDYDVSGNLQTYPPYYAAAQVAGLLSSQTDPAEPLTNKTIPISGIETISSIATIDNLVNGGVFTYKNDPVRGFVIVQSLTTWTGDTKFARREVSTLRAADAVSKRVRDAVVSKIGSKSTVFLQSALQSIVTSVLGQAEQNGLIVADPTNPTLFPAFKNVVVRVVGDAFYIDFNISPAKPANYILITAYVS